ncbi:MAG: hypothetical protein Q8S31_06650 [Alphaproteobacteria bacterium]|nr:hypothetical protein [Alphaproteobacteria bacterium]
MKKLAITSLMVMSFVATSYADEVVGVTDTHLRTKHMKSGKTESSVVGAKHTGLPVGTSTPEDVTLFFGGIGKFLDENLHKVKDLGKDLGKTAIGALNAKVNKTATPAEVSAAADASSPIASEG